MFFVVPGTLATMAWPVSDYTFDMKNKVVKQMCVRELTAMKGKPIVGPV